MSDGTGRRSTWSSANERRRGTGGRPGPQDARRRRSPRARGRDLRFLWSILVPADETVFCFFDGDETDVRTVSEQAGVPFERVLEWLRIDGRPNAEDKA